MIRLLPAAVFITAIASAAPPEVRLVDGPAKIEASIELPAALPAGASHEELLSISLLDDAGRAGPPLLGSYRVAGARLIFTPHFALAGGARYRVRSGGGAIEHSVPLAKQSAEARLTSVHPAGGSVPANLLKFYLHFSKPMREGREVFTHLHLLDSSGKPVDAPWRDTELWSEDARRLTLWIHPGRVKRGVNLREELGPVLRPGETYTLLVDAGLRDAGGQPLGCEYRREFKATAEIHQRLDLADWSYRIPAAGTRKPFHATAPTPLDHALALRCLRVRAGGREIPGKIALGDDGRAWTFTPTRPWEAESYHLEADPWMEDLAGNTFARVFDHDTTARRDGKAPRTSWSFLPRPAGGR